VSVGDLDQSPQALKALAKARQALEAEESVSKQLFQVDTQNFAQAVRLLLEIRKPRFAGVAQAVEDVSECATMIGEYSSLGASVLGAAGSVVPGIGNAVGAIIGSIGGAIVAAWECGALAWLREGLEAIGEWLIEVFDPKPEEFQIYIDVAGPAVRRTGFTLDAKKEERLLLGLLPEGPFKKNALAFMTTNLPGSKASPIEARWLLRRTMELGGGVEEFALLNRVLGNEDLRVERSRVFYDRILGAWKSVPKTLQHLKKPLLFDALRRGGFTAAEARKEVYDTVRKQDGIELAYLRELLKSYQPGDAELVVRAKLARRGQAVAIPDLRAALAALPESVRPKLPPPAMRSGVFDASRMASDEPKTEDSGSMVPLLLLGAAAAFLLLRK
jgi:hypothetical protein